MRKINILKIVPLISIFSLILVFVGCSENVTDKAADKSTEKNIQNVTESAPPPTTPSESPTAQEYFIKVEGNRPFAVAFDNLGAMYMVTAPTSGDGTLSKVSADGTVTELATLEGSFIGPGIDVDNDGNAYITVGNKLLKVSPEGNISVIAEGFSRCFDVKIGSDDNLFVADDVEATIYSVSPSGEKSVFYKGEKKGNYIITSLIFDKDNNRLYAKENNRILSFDISGNTENANPVLVADNLDMFYLCMDSQNNICLSSPNTGNIQRLDANGNATNVNTSPLPTPIGLASGGKGFDKDYLYVCVRDGIVKIPILN